MVAVPKEDRILNHISKPLKHQMRYLINRTRWPVLVTYSDESVGHTGHVYKCSGWQPTVRNKVKTFTQDGRRVSSYSNGKTTKPKDAVEGYAWIQRWEHHIDNALESFNANWVKEPILGKVWRSGNQAYRYVEANSFT